MQEIIEPIIHKAAVHDLQTKIKHTGLCIGDPAEPQAAAAARGRPPARLRRPSESC